MTDRQKIVVGMGAAMAWSALLIWIGSTQVQIPAFSRILVQPFYLLGPGLILLVMVTWLAASRFFDDALIEGETPIGSRAEINQRVLKNTVEQAVLAACLWPPISYLLPETGIGIVVCLSVNFFFARTLFWLGYHLATPLRAFGFGATFYPTLLALAWAVLWWIVT